MQFVFEDADELALASTGGGAAQPDVSALGQTQWDDEGDGHDKPVPRRPEDVEASAAYHAKTPEPNYEQFRPEFVDQHGREYALARAGKFLERQQDDVDNGRFDTPPRKGTARAGRLLMWLRMPINQRWSVPLPDPDGEELVLYHVATQVKCVAKTDGVFVATPRARTGHVFVRDFESRGQVLDPTPYEPWLRTGKPPGRELI